MYTVCITDRLIVMTIVVFIGQGLDQQLLTETLDKVLLTDSEWASWEKVTLSPLSQIADIADS